MLTIINYYYSYDVGVMLNIFQFEFKSFLSQTWIQQQYNKGMKNCWFYKNGLQCINETNYYYKPYRYVIGI